MFEAIFPLAGADSIFAYTRDVRAKGQLVPCNLDARMFSPLDGIGENPATGSAVAAFAALLAKLGAFTQSVLRVRQGLAMARPSLLQARIDGDGKADRRVRVSGDCVAVMSGTIYLPDLQDVTV